MESQTYTCNVVVPFGANRETGEILVRTRRCVRGRNPQLPLIYHQIDREGAVNRLIRKSEDLPLRPCLWRWQILKRSRLGIFF